MPLLAFLITRLHVFPFSPSFSPLHMARSPSSHFHFKTDRCRLVIHLHPRTSGSTLSLLKFLTQVLNLRGLELISLSIPFGLTTRPPWSSSLQLSMDRVIVDMGSTIHFLASPSLLAAIVGRYCAALIAGSWLLFYLLYISNP